MTVRAALSFSRQSLRRGRRSFVLSVFGIGLGISVLGFFLALSLGLRKNVVGRLFPPGRLEVVKARSSLSALGDLGDLLGGQRPLDEEVVRHLVALPGVVAVYPRMKAAFPVRGWGGEAILGRPLYTELVIDGIDAAAVSERTGPLPFADHHGKPGTFCTDDKGCAAPAYCAWDINRCELPVPVVVSPMLLELYNGTIARLHNLPKLKAGGFLVSQLGGLSLTAELGRSFVARQAQVGKARQRRLMLVGVSERAMAVGITVPLPYVRRWNAEYAAAAAAEFSSLTVELAEKGRTTEVVQAVRKLGFAVEDNGAEQAGLAVLLLSAVLLLVSLAIVVLSIVNIGHSFFRAVSERRRELGVLRAVGASARDVEVLILLEAAILGLIGGAVGLLCAVLSARAVDLVSRRYLPDFPFKPDSYFLFSPGLCALAILLAIVGCLCGAYFPARAAAREDPAAALVG